MKYLFFIFFGIFTYAQNRVEGRVLSEYDFALEGVLITNTRTGNQINSNSLGDFSIEASWNDELRFIKENYKSASRLIENRDFLAPISIKLLRVPFEIEEVYVSNNPTGILENDLKKFRPSKKFVDLNSTIRESFKRPIKVNYPINNVPSSFSPIDPYAGQVNLLSVSIGGSSGGIMKLIDNRLKRQRIKLNYSEIESFHKKVKKHFYGNYYIENGLNESLFDAYIHYLDNQYQFSENYSNNFDSTKVDYILRSFLKDYLEKKL